MRFFRKLNDLFVTKQNISFVTEALLGKQACISKDKYRELSDYAKEKNVKISNFKRYTGDINIIKTALDDIASIALDFPRILEGRRKLELNLDFYSSDDVFATTVHHIIYINASLYSSEEYLSSEYDLAVQQGKFVKNTNYRSIIRHETGHVVANIYKINPMQVAKSILGLEYDYEVLNYIKNELSLYAADFPDGREFISESFSGYYSNVDNNFARLFVGKCKMLEGGCSDETK